MTETKKEKLDAILAALQNVGQVDACAIVSREGLVMAERIPPEVNAKIFSALCASVMGAAETAMVQMKKGGTDEIIVKGKEGQLIVVPAGSKAILVCLAQHPHGKDKPGKGVLLHKYNAS
ncbi:MAG: roadblock/LC7 domain-containing protein [Candidatus Syntropharchaeia archaeon]